jgi:hypothetical protein
VKRSPHRHAARRAKREARYTSAVRWVNEHLQKGFIELLNDSRTPLYYDQASRDRVINMAEVLLESYLPSSPVDVQVGVDMESATLTATITFKKNTHPA